MPKRNWHRAGLEASGGLQEGCPPLLCLPFTHTHAVRHMRWPRHCSRARLVHFLLPSSFFSLCLSWYHRADTTPLWGHLDQLCPPRQPGRSIRSIHLGSNGYRWQDLSLYRHLESSVFFFFLLPSCLFCRSFYHSVSPNLLREVRFPPVGKKNHKWDRFRISKVAQNDSVIKFRFFFAEILCLSDFSIQKKGNLIEEISDCAQICQEIKALFKFFKNWIIRAIVLFHFNLSTFIFLFILDFSWIILAKLCLMFSF